jgi:predicted DNA-binding protein YlxM (UPF0122 family)
MIELDIEKRNKEILDKFYNTDLTLEELGNQYAVSSERIRQILSGELGEDNYRAASVARVNNRSDKTAEIARQVNEDIADEIISLVNKGNELLTLQQICDQYDVSSITAAAVLSTIKQKIGTETVHVLAVQRISKNRQVQYSDKDVLSFAKRAYRDLSAEGRSFTANSYSEWRERQKDACPTHLTLIKRMSDSNRWADVRSAVTGVQPEKERGPSGPQRVWTILAIIAILKDFLAWAAKADRFASQRAYSEYQASTSKETPSLALIRLRMGSWIHAIESAKSSNLTT